ncbi:MAG: hypothetical protein JRI41_02945 [Deltaproteobacteria bacterium]|nr:hypothetical protein [Deltaproteobacteria bacterium]
MGTVATYGDRAGLKVRDPNYKQFPKTVRLGIFNDILETLYQKLVAVESNLVYAEGTQVTVDGTAEYTPSFNFDGFLRAGSWVDGEDTYLKQVPESDKIRFDYGSTKSQPEAFYVTEGGAIGYLWVPDDAYTVHHQYWMPITALTDYDTDDLPWGGVFNRVIERLLVIEMLEILELDNSRHAALAEIEMSSAMAMVYARGIRPQKVVSNMFSAEGI